MADRPNERVTLAVLGARLEGMDQKLDTLVADHDALVRVGMQSKQNKSDIADLRKSTRKETLVEMAIAALIGASAWLKQ